MKLITESKKIFSVIMRAWETKEYHLNTHTHTQKKNLKNFMQSRPNHKINQNS